MNTSIDFVCVDLKTHEVYLCNDGQVVKVDGIKSPRQFIEDLCLRNGTTLEGCYEASRRLLENAYKRPIYIGGKCNQIFVPTCSIKNRECNWISLDFLLKKSLHTFNLYGFEEMSDQRWNKHLADGIALRREIFVEEAA